MTRSSHCLMVALLAIACATARAQDPLEDLFPISEAHLLEPADRWPEWVELEDSVRNAVLASLGFVDSTGAPYDRVEGYEISRSEGADGMELVAYYLNGHVDEHDDYVYVTMQRDGRMVDKTLVAQLQTSCRSTYLRASTLREDGVIVIQQLEHHFSCETQEFLETIPLPAFGVEMRPDGTFNEVEIEPR